MCGGESKDYSKSGLSIRQAMLDHAKQFPDKDLRPDYICWGSHRVRTGDFFPVPRRGTVRGEFLRSRADYPQGFDLKVDGWIELHSGKRVEILRTWDDPKYESFVEYSYFSRDSRLRIWNVYQRPRGDQLVEEKWTGNAGFWIEELGEFERVYHCSHGVADPPDFECLVFKISVVR